MAEQQFRQRPGDQLLPRTDQRTGPSVQDRLIERIQERRELGRQRYGTDLRTWNGRDAVRDALEEALDLASYLTQVEMEMQELSADGGNGTLIDLLSRAGFDVSRDNVIRLSQMVERFQRWALAQVTAKTNWLARKLADEHDEKTRLQYQLDKVSEQLAVKTAQVDKESAAADARYEMLLVAWEPCTPKWVAEHAPGSCALSARAWLPRGDDTVSHYHPRGVTLLRENAAERAVERADMSADLAGYEDEEGEQ